MNKASLINQIMVKTGLAKANVEPVVESFLALVTTELQAGGKVSLVGFGAFTTKERHARGGINPQHPGQRIQIPAVRVAKFKSGKALKEQLRLTIEN